MTFQALLLTQADGKTAAAVTQLDESALPADGNVLVAVDYSTINFKDGLAITGRAPVVRKWPMVAGIDGAGTVLDSSDPRWRTGDRVVLNGFGVGETHWGCLAQRARLQGDWLVRLPDAFTSRQAMAIGTAGYTAMLSVLALERGGALGPVKPGDGEVLVTGASGGVGSVAIAILSKLGYRVVASTGKTAEADFLRALGAADVIDRAELGAPGKPLQKERWAGVVDSVGSHTLVNACAQVRYGGVVTACGLAQGMDFPASVAPFILRGVTLAGIDSVMAPMSLRETAWKRLARDLAPDRLQAITREIRLGEAIDAASQIMAGGMRGRVVVDVNA
ncbi:alcohol dehydrogenase [Cupriavidus sp. OV038]|jgi:acrylyl-CoA reductase (NADPH)|uniref:acrylyl-CoA reductase (NADPH) n=1 Tax=unclassified Cupriavidus TaxID=2640874 RepID=UPI0008EB4BAB|nr:MULTISPECIES: MDR family oxidoreductase [unclassified Cupriavidus]SFD20057.1 alcohol dehydrogenase [Cupriavidus sp. OV038]SFP86548.1 alcohol dehydrogenase [Cupriavidus sp. OV096]